MYHIAHMVKSSGLAFALVFLMTCTFSPADWTQRRTNWWTVANTCPKAEYWIYKGF